MNYKKLNEILKDLNNPGSNCKLISTDQSSNYHDEKNQGEEGLKVSIYDIGEDVFLKVVRTSDSYGDNESVSSIQFVVAEEKVVQIFKEV